MVKAALLVPLDGSSTLALPTLNSGGGVVSCTVAVPVPWRSTPLPLGVPSARVKVSLPSTRLSPRIEMATVFCVSPGAKVRVPLAPI